MNNEPGTSEPDTNLTKRANAMQTYGIPMFIDRHGWNPSELLHQDLLSDYASEPEDAGETKEAWKIRMAKASGIDH